MFKTVFITGHDLHGRKVLINVSQISHICGLPGETKDRGTEIYMIGRESSIWLQELPESVIDLMKLIIQ